MISGVLCRRFMESRMNYDIAEELNGLICKYCVGTRYKWVNYQWWCPRIWCWKPDFWYPSQILFRFNPDFFQILYRFPDLFRNSLYLDFILIFERIWIKLKKNHFLSRFYFIWIKGHGLSDDHYFYDFICRCKDDDIFTFNFFYLVGIFLEVVKVDIFIVSVRNSFSNFLLQNPRHLSNRFGIDFPNSLIKLSHIALKLTCRTMSIECNALYTGCNSENKWVKSAGISPNVFHLKWKV